MFTTKFREEMHNQIVQADIYAETEIMSIIFFSGLSFYEISLERRSRQRNPASASAGPLASFRLAEG